jgi:hypothetical protein
LSQGIEQKGEERVDGEEGFTSGTNICPWWELDVCTTLRFGKQLRAISWFAIENTPVIRACNSIQLKD